jgi:UDP-3-O-acyl-N-acetylglucosamine deacetylase
MEYDFMLGQSTSKLIDEHRLKYKDESFNYKVLDIVPPLLIPT